MTHNSTRRWYMAALTAVLCAGSVALTAPAAPAAPAAPTARVAVEAGTLAPDTIRAAPRITRAQVLARAKTWLTANNGRPVPYSQTKYWKDGYRQDCSGYVSMALGLPKPGPNTVALKNNGFTRRIAMKDLAPGDLVLKANSNSADYRHVVIFDGWANSAHTAYKSYEQAGGVGTRWKQHSYGVNGRDGYHAYRPVNITG
ncbi:C40 family peptidase [Streptomyces sp. RerS4]|uniref:C40 family peptidase n=1 Tax=Streptomyces sp. RerS4 TaxID=2942449 RepID=UPI00201BE3DB|nr:C40 family peptidase [Streptomyces sp. RerS4]UQX04576.1 C40 family peptidase [Streptomyces sp. RerS4]